MGNTAGCLPVAFDFGSPTTHADCACVILHLLALGSAQLVLSLVKSPRVEGGWVGQINYHLWIVSYLELHRRGRKRGRLIMPNKRWHRSFVLGWVSVGFHHCKADFGSAAISAIDLRCSDVLTINKLVFLEQNQELIQWLQTQVGKVDVARDKSEKWKPEHNVS